MIAVASVTVTMTVTTRFTVRVPPRTAKKHRQLLQKLCQEDNNTLGLEGDKLNRRTK